VKINKSDRFQPKLDSAMRIIPEWTTYDNEIKELLAGTNATASARRPAEKEAKEAEREEL
jgi:hypothetical protein